MGGERMYEIIKMINIFCISLFLAGIFVVYTTINSINNKKNISKFILLTTIVILKIMYLINMRYAETLVKEYSIGFYMILVTDFIILLLIFLLNNETLLEKKEIALLILDYILSIVSFSLSYNNIYNEINIVIIVMLMGFNIYFFFKKYPKPIQVFSLFYIINFVFILQKDTMELLIYSNNILDLAFAIIILLKLLLMDIRQPYIKCIRIMSNINRSKINIKLYDEKLNNCKMENVILKEDLKTKEDNLNILLGQFSKSAFLIDNNNYIINQDIVFDNMFPKYAHYNYPINLDEFLHENIAEEERFVSSLEKVKYSGNSNFTQITGKDGRIFEAAFYVYEEYDSPSIICILSDITYENKIKIKTEESDIKYKKIAQNIPYAIILEKNGEIVYNNNNLDINIDNVMSIILNNATKGELNFLDSNGEDIYINIDRIEFMEENDTLSLIEVKDVTNYKRVLCKLEESTNEYETLIDIIPEAICVLDYESKEFEYANNTFYNLLKIQDIESMDFDEIYNDITISSGNLNESIKYIRKTLKDSYGGIINIESSIVLIEVDRATKMVLIMRDITEEIKVESLKKEIEETRMINKDIDDFFINMSHELFTPVNLINISNQYIQRVCKEILEKNPNGEFANSIFITKKYVEILSTLIDKITELSKLENNYHKDSKDIYEIVNLCEDIVTEVNRYTNNNEITVLFDTEEEEVYCEIDPNDLGKAILTLLSSIVKHSKNNSTINFNIKTKVDKVIIIIENINRYDYEKHFDKYEEKILQLSMSIAKLIINLYKGKIKIDTKEKNSIKIEVELYMEKDIEEAIIPNKVIDEDFIYKEYKKICDL